MSYSIEEMVDMHLMYGLADCNASLANRLYAERFPDRRQPSRSMFQRLHQRLRDTGSLEKQTIDLGRSVSTRTVNIEKRILRYIEGHDDISVRKIAAAEKIGRSTVWRVLQQLYPPNIQPVQALKSADFCPRINFCTWFLQMCTNQDFLQAVLFTDEIRFTRNGVIHFHHQEADDWDEEHPRFVRQFQFNVNVWVGILGDNLIGPVFLDEKLTDKSYANFLKNQLHELLEDIPLDIMCRMWFMHHGTSPHFDQATRKFLNKRFPGKWIGHEGHTDYPAHSPDLNPVDFCLWSYLKTVVYSIPITSIKMLRQRIENGCQKVQQKAGLFEKVRSSTVRRMQACILANGDHFEQFLQN